MKYVPQWLGLAVEVLVPGALDSIEECVHSQLPVERADSMPASISPRPLAKGVINSWEERWAVKERRMLRRAQARKGLQINELSI